MMGTVGTIESAQFRAHKATVSERVMVRQPRNASMLFLQDIECKVGL
jgi:hypothetical protein